MLGRGEQYSSKMDLPSDGSGHEVLESYIDTVGVLFKLRLDDTAREDFLAGKVLKHQNLEAMLGLLDSLLEMFMPVLSSENHLSTSNAATHFCKLLERSEEVFEIVSEVETPFKYRYDTWMDALIQLKNCSYWRKSTSKQRIDKPDTKKEQCFADVTSEEEASVKAGNASENCKRMVKFRDGRPRASMSNTTKYASSLRSDSEDSSDSKGPSKARRSSKKGNMRRRSKKVTGVIHLPSDESDSTSDSETDASCERRTKRRYKYVTKDVVSPEVFDGNGRTSMKEFFKEFNAYYDIKFEDKHDKTGKLRCRKLAEFLEGDALRAYDNYGGKYVYFDEMQEELLSWYKSTKVGSSYQRKAEFTQASMDSDETYKLYCMRLEELAYRAFPHRKSERVRELIDKVSTTVPKEFRRSIEKREETKRTFDPKAVITWDDIVHLAEDTDRKKKKQQLMNSGAVSPTRHAIANITVENPVQESPLISAHQQGTARQGYARQERMVVSNTAGCCHYCGMMGHTEARCRKKYFKTATCFGCNEVGHGIRVCPNRATGSNQQAPEGMFKPVCGICGGPHLGMDCTVSLPPMSLGSGQAPQKNINTGAITKSYDRSQEDPRANSGGTYKARGGAARGGWNRGGRNGGGNRQSPNYEPIGNSDQNSSSSFSGNLNPLVK